MSGVRELPGLPGCCIIDVCVNLAATPGDCVDAEPISLPPSGATPSG